MVYSDAAILGWANIAQFLGVSHRKIFSHRDDLLRLHVVFYIRRGRPPRTTAAAFPSDLIAWAKFKASQGEII